MTCVELITGSLVDLRTYKGGGPWMQEPDYTPIYTKVPCGLTTTHTCATCDKAICRWHLIARHDHTFAASRKVRH